ncbi:unnamed protein product [Protopolystoma xenopodis]|uniref:Uncharacterized protein n=1 Tax=Protopolystoma xenopodis TaxID=117903 RepID=A0A3S5CN04_9PLAT|nr:unnamed protein product [Protopolystoma xenopodis]
MSCRRVVEPDCPNQIKAGRGCGKHPIPAPFKSRCSASHGGNLLIRSPGCCHSHCRKVEKCVAFFTGLQFARQLQLELEVDLAHQIAALCQSIRTSKGYCQATGWDEGPSKSASSSEEPVSNTVQVGRSTLSRSPFCPPVHWLSVKFSCQVQLHRNGAKLRFERRFAPLYPVDMTTEHVLLPGVLQSRLPRRTHHLTALHTITMHAHTRTQAQTSDPKA